MRHLWTVPAAALLLLWPALWNGYPLLFGDTGVYIHDGAHLHVTWARPMFYGLFMLPLHLRLDTWPVVIAQALIAATLLRVTLLAFLPLASPLLLLPVALVLAAGTSLPWFVSQLMPDVFAGLMILALSAALLVPERLGRVGTVVAGLFAAFCITMHLSLLPIALAAIVTLWAARLLLGLRLRGADLLRGVAIPALAALIIVLPNAVLLHKPSLSPYGKIFMLVRLIADGPGQRVLDRQCPQPGWTLCPLKDELDPNSDAILWGPKRIMVRAGGQDAVVAQAGPIIAAAIAAEPGTVAGLALRNAASQLVSFASGDELLKPSSFNDEAWEIEFPPAERARYHAGRQYRLLELLPSWLQAIHIAFAAAAMLATPILAWRALRRGEALGGLYLVVPVTLLANAVVTGALSGVFDRYQSRFVWLAPLALLLFLIERRQARAAC